MGTADHVDESFGSIGFVLTCGDNRGGPGRMVRIRVNVDPGSPGPLKLPFVSVDDRLEDCACLRRSFSALKSAAEDGSQVPVCRLTETQHMSALRDVRLVNEIRWIMLGFSNYRKDPGHDCGECEKETSARHDSPPWVCLKSPSDCQRPARHRESCRASSVRWINPLFLASVTVRFLDLSQQTFAFPCSFPPMSNPTRNFRGIDIT